MLTSPSTSKRKRSTQNYSRAHSVKNTSSARQSYLLKRIRLVFAIEFLGSSGKTKWFGVKLPIPPYPLRWPSAT